MTTTLTPPSKALQPVPGTKQIIDGLLALNKITYTDVQNLTPAQSQYLGQTCTKKLEQLTGPERDHFLEKIEMILQPDTKNDIWEYNHTRINEAVSAYIQQHGAMPAKSTIANQTGLSRQTVAKHFKEYKRHPEFGAQMEQFQFLAPQVLSNVYRCAVNGNMRAARLYFDMVGATGKPAATAAVNTQNNYIQVNNTILSQENLTRLSTEQLNQIESIINGARG